MRQVTCSRAYFSKDMQVKSPFSAYPISCYEIPHLASFIEALIPEINNRGQQ